jgi:hypothetical protein
LPIATRVLPDRDTGFVDRDTGFVDRDGQVERPILSEAPPTSQEKMS